MYKHNLLKQKACQHHSKTHANIKSLMIKLLSCQKKKGGGGLTLQPYKNTELFSTHDSTHTNNSLVLKTAAHEYKSSYFIFQMYISWLIVIFF